jgi:L-cystine uptake protein TcyP (sodium:dicarboxylate symporter family)
MSSQTAVRFARRDLQGSFFARYDLMVLALCIGGVVLSLLLTAVTGSLDDGVMVPSRPLETLQLAVCALVVGGILGAIEGVILAFSLAWLLGLFRDLGLSPLDRVARVDLAAAEDLGLQATPVYEGRQEAAYARHVHEVLARLAESSPPRSLAPPMRNSRPTRWFRGTPRVVMLRRVIPAARARL